MEPELLDLVGCIYDCAIEPNHWSVALERITRLVGGLCAGIYIQDPIKRQTRFLHEWNTNEHYQRLYYEKYAALNPMLTSGWFAEIDEPITQVGFLGESEWVQSVAYKEWAAPQGLYDSVGVTLVRTSNVYAQIAVLRTKDRGLCTKSDIDNLRLLAPHIRRALMISDLLEARTLHADMLSATLDLMSAGVLLLDLEQRIVHANRGATRFLEAEDAIRRDDGRLLCNDPQAALEMARAVDQTTTGDPSKFGEPGIAVPIPSTNGRDLSAWVLPLDRGLRGELGAPFTATTAIFIRELANDAPFPGELFVRRYTITPAELRVLILLVQGMNPGEAATTLGISRATVKTHLERLYAKTSTRRQAELVRLAMSALSPTP